MVGNRDPNNVVRCETQKTIADMIYIVISWWAMQPSLPSNKVLLLCAERD